MLCAKLNQWPFAQPPHAATAAQTLLYTHVFIELLPKRESDPGSAAPHGKADKHTMRQWRDRFKRKD